MPASVHRCIALVCLLAAFSFGATTAVRGQAVDESALKAAYLLNFIALTSWPVDAPNAPAAITACIASPPVADAFVQMVLTRKASGRTIATRRVTDTDLLFGCSLLYLSQNESRRYGKWLAALRGAVLTVGESPDFLEAGGMASFFIENGRMRFAISLPAAEASPLRLSSKLLSLAKLIRSPGGR